MKEAAGEANMTVITIVLIGVVAGVGLLLVPKLMKNAKAKACCTDAGGVISGKFCYVPTSGNGYLTNFCTTSGCGQYVLTGDAFKNDSRFSACMQ